MAGDTTHVKGLSELQKFLDTLPVKLERNVMRSSLRAGMNVVKPAAQANIHHQVSGLLARGLKVGTRARGGVVTARLRATGPHAAAAHWLEFGTAAHWIRAKLAKALSWGSVFTKEVWHPGTHPKPFMRPALDAQAQAATIAAAEYIKARLQTKEGIDTSHVMIEGDE